MKRTSISFQREWRVIKGTSCSQAAVMVIAPGDSEGGPQNKHAGDQWLYVVEGTGTAIIEGRKLPLKPGSLIIIEKGERHEIKATGRSKLKTINFYSPPQY